jgi:hypothetical protein
MIPSKKIHSVNVKTPMFTAALEIASMASVCDKTDMPTTATQHAILSMYATMREVRREKYGYSF